MLKIAVALAGIVVAGSVLPAWAALLDTVINPDDDSSQFDISYQSTVELRYADGGMLYDELFGKEWTVSGSADSSHPAVQDLMDRLNAKIRSDGSQATVSDLDVTYKISLNSRTDFSSIDYSVEFEGVLTGYVIASTPEKHLIDLGWHALSVDGPVVIDGTDINIPLNLIRDQEPEVYAVFSGTDAESVLARPVIKAGYVPKPPLSNWHYLFDPTGISVDAGTFGLSDEIAGSGVSRWTSTESIYSKPNPIIATADIISDQKYSVKTTTPFDSVALAVIGLALPDRLDGIDIARVSTSPPSESPINPNDYFLTAVIYGMVGLAVVAGIGFFVFINRSLKNEKQGQQGIDSAHLVGYQTNRGEAQLRDDAGYSQTRNVYESSPQPSSEPEAACGCAASAEMGSECDCEMQGSCLCDATCQCAAALCKEHSDSMR